MDITNAYVKKTSMRSEPIYVHALPDGQGNTASGHKTGKLLKHLWDGRSAGQYYISVPFSFLLRHGYTQTDTERCLF